MKTVRSPISALKMEKVIKADHTQTKEKMIEQRSFNNIEHGGANLMNLPQIKSSSI